MKLLIAGSRNWNPSIAEIDEEVSKLLSIVFDTGWALRSCITEVVSGKARGADRCGEIWARSKGIPIKPFPAEWHLYGKRAGPMRNTLMADYVDFGIIFCRASSTGSQDMITKMEARKKLTIVRRS